jgi:PKD repeat protein
MPHKMLLFATCLLALLVPVTVASAAGPAASASPSSIGQADAGDTFYQFTVIYTDDVAVDYNSVNLNDNAVRVSNGALGYDALATYIGAFPTVDSDTIVAFYEVTPPGGTWNDADNGTYTISMESNQVFDTSAVAVSAGTLATFVASMDTTAPATPSRPDLIAASDAGESSTDNLTNVTLPTFVGTAEANSTVQVFRTPGSPVGTTTANASGNWSLTAGSTIPEGSFAFRATATDAAGNTSGVTSSLIVVFDRTAPVAPGAPDLQAASDTGSSSTDDLTKQSQPAFSGTAISANRVTLSSNISGTLGSVIAGSGAWNITATAPLIEGAHVLSAVQRDVAGNTSVASSTLSITVDTTAPSAPGTPDLDVSNDSGQSSSDNVTTATAYSLNGSKDANTFVNLYLNGSPLGATSATAGTTWSFAANTNFEGVQSFNAESVDIAGNVSATSSPLNVTFDYTAPSAPTTPDLANGSDTGKSNSDNLFKSLPAAFEGTGEASATLRLHDQATSVVYNTATVSGGGTWSVSINSLNEGTHGVYATLEDLAGNSSVLSSVLTVVYDATAPTAPGQPDLLAASDSGSSDSDNTTNVLPTTIEGSAEASSDLTLESSIDGSLGTVSADSSGEWSMNVASLSENVHTILARCVDAAGNESSNSAVLTLTFDSTAPSPPSVPDLDTASDTGASNSDNLTADSTPDLSGSAESNSVLTLSSASQANLVTGLAGASGSWSFTLPALTDGEHVLSAVAKDLAGNTSVASTAMTLRVATTVPNVSVSAMPASINEAQTSSVVVTLDAITPENVDVTIATTGTAIETSDYTLSAHSVQIAAGALTVSSDLFALADGLDEEQETVLLSLSNAAYANFDSSAQFSASIVDIDAEPSVNISSVSIVEGTNSGMNSAELVVSVTPVSGRTVSVPFTVSGTATQGTDFVIATSSPLEFLAGESSHVVEVLIAPDEFVEGDENVVVTLGAPANAVLGTASAALDIQDDDTPTTVAGISRSGVTPTRESNVAFDVTFSEAVTGVDLSDFAPVSVSGTLAGMSVENVQGSDDHFVVTVSTGSGDGELGLSVHADGTIVDSDGNALSADYSSSDNYMVDKSKPVITLNGESLVSVYPGDVYTDAGAYALDNLDGDVTPEIVTTNPVDTSAMGVYTVRFNVSDAAGNAANEVTRTVRVFDAAKTFVVDGSTVSGVEDGSTANPYSTISAALAKCQAGRGDTVVVRRGVYAEDLTVVPFTNLKSELGAYHTLVLGSVILSDGTSLIGFSINAQPDATAVESVENATVTLTNNAIANGGAGYHATANTKSTLANNTFFNHGVCGIKGEASAVFERMKNNIISDCAMGMSVAGNSLVDEGFNAFWNNGVDAQGAAFSSTDMVSDPAFVDASTGNFHLVHASPMRDAGDPASEYNDLDGSINDLGADGGPNGVMDTASPIADLVVSAESGDVPLNVHFDASGSNDEWGIQHYTWDFDAVDGVKSDATGETADFTYTAAGSYTATLVLEDNNGLTSEKHVQIVVTSPATNPPVVTLSVTPNAGPAPLRAKLKATGFDPDGGPVKFYWDLNNDGILEQVQGANQTVAFSEKTRPGSYAINVVAMDNQHSTTMAKAYVTITWSSRIQTMVADPSKDSLLVFKDGDKEFDGASMLVRKNAISEPLVLTLGPIEPGRGRELPPRAVSHGFEAGPTGVVFGKPVRLTIPLKQKPMRPDLIRILRWNDVTKKWDDATVTNLVYTRDSKPTVSFDTSELGIFLVKLGAAGNDLDLDGRVNAVDVQLSINSTLRRPVEYDCDSDGDGQQTATDMQSVTNAAVSQGNRGHN